MNFDAGTGYGVVGILRVEKPRWVFPAKFIRLGFARFHYEF